MPKIDKKNAKKKEEEEDLDIFELSDEDEEIYGEFDDDDFEEEEEEEKPLKISLKKSVVIKKTEKPPKEIEKPTPIKKSLPIDIPKKKASKVDYILDGIIKTPGLVIVNGKSKRGKSYLIKYMITCLGIQKKFKFGLVFCKTKFNGGYDFFPNEKIIEGYNEETLKKYMETLKKYGEDHPISDSQKAKGIKTNIPPSLIVFDDLIGSLDTNQKFFTEFITTYRHYNISVIIATQYINKVSTTLREQADLCFMFEPSTDRSIKALYESYGQQFDTPKKFKDFLLEKTKEPYHCLIYNENGTDEDKYLVYCAPSQYPEVVFDF